MANPKRCCKPAVPNEAKTSLNSSCRPLSKLRQLLCLGATLFVFLAPEIRAEHIQQSSEGNASQSERLGPLPRKFNSLQEKLFEENYTAFVGEVKTKLPNLDLTGIPAPKFDPNLSRQEAAELFISWVARQKHMPPEEREKFIAETRPLLVQEFRDKTTVKLALLTPVTAPNQTKPPIRALTRVPVAPAPPASEYPFHVNEYVDQRLAAAAREFITETHAAAYLHAGTRDETLSYHASEGFTEAYLLRARAAGKPFLIFRNPASGKFRIAASDFIGRDTFAQVATRMARIPGLQKIT